MNPDKYSHFIFTLVTVLYVPYSYKLLRSIIVAVFMDQFPHTDILPSNVLILPLTRGK